MLVLALDTTHQHGSIALAREGRILEVAAIEAADGFGHTIYQEIEALLARHSVRLSDLEGYAAASGPGSFSGIRVGLSVVKSLAEAHQKQVVPVSNLMAMAFAAEGRFRAPVMDARRGQVFAAVYDESLRVMAPEVASPWADFLALVGEREMTFVSTDAALFEAAGAAPLDGNSRAGWRRMAVSALLATPIALIAAARLREGLALAPEAVDANYVRRADAKGNWQDLA
jgi:tRNA threonylcarbamoyladenosine biosynthesis protein TsaB